VFLLIKYLKLLQYRNISFRSRVYFGTKKINQKPGGVQGVKCVNLTFNSPLIIAYIDLNINAEAKLIERITT